MNENIMSFLPGWETVDCIGTGSSGKVYELRKRDEYGGDFHCALKVISVPATQEEYDEMLANMDEFTMRAKLREKVEEISNEYRLMGSLRGHPNIVNCEDQMVVPHTDDMGWDIYIRMELLTSLPNYLKEHGMTAAEVIKLGSDICNALALCRENNIIHRDIKPQNIFVSRYGDFKLGDFSVAQNVELASADKVGTYSYMAPEVYKGKKYDYSVDIYSLGVVLYWLLNERRGPFLPLPPQTPTTEQIADAQLRRYRGEAVPPPKNGNAALKKAVQRACAYSSANRFASPSEMRKALQMAANGALWEPEPVYDSDATVKEESPVKPRPQPETYTPPKPQPQPRPQPKPQPKPQPQPVEEKKEPGGIKPGYIVVLVLLVIAMATAVILLATGGLDITKPNHTKPVTTASPKPTESAEPATEIYSIVLSSPRLTLTVEDEGKLNVSCLPELREDEEPPKYVWKSSDPAIASVDGEGNVKALSEGTATVMVYIEGKMELSDECMVIVEQPKLVQLSIETMPVKTVYSMGEELDTEGLVLRAYYSNGSAQRITNPAEYTVECDMTGLGTRTATVTYKDMTTEYTVRISLF